MRELSSLESLALFSSLLSCAVAYLWSRALKSTAPLPPGPKANWLGRVDLPRIRPWLTYAEWRDVYGDLIYIRVFGNPILVLNSASVTSDLLEKRGGNYSSRPIRTMIVELIGWDWLVSGAICISIWKPMAGENMRFLYRAPQKNDADVLAASDYIQETHLLLRSLMHNPLDFRYHIRKLAARIILKMTYGHQVGTGEEYTVLADKAIASLAQAGIFGTYLVDYIPCLKHAPAWFPFQRKAREWRKLTRAMLNSPFDSVKEELAKGTASKCMVSEELERLSDPADESIIRNTAATMYAAGADTAVSAISTFFLAMAIYPDVQKRGQQEMDRAIGHGQRLPLFSDRSQLPFIDYVCYELLRWNPVTPLGIAHYVQQEDEYRGFRIPAGTTVLPNVWAILHDPDMYPDPLAFNPQRFAPENRVNGMNQIPDPAFGFGRRVCPGRYLAYDSLWIVVASVLAVYNISKEIDETGAVKEPVVEFTPHLLSHPMPFGCTITPRSAAARRLIAQTELDT